jgi:hypothetical protein
VTEVKFDEYGPSGVIVSRRVSISSTKVLRFVAMNRKPAFAAMNALADVLPVTVRGSVWLRVTVTVSKSALTTSVFL